MKNKYLSHFGVAAITASLALPALAKSPKSISIEPIGSIAAGAFLTSAAEISVFDPATKRLFVVNAQVPRIDVVSISDPANPTLVGVIEITSYGAIANSVAVKNGIIAVAVEAEAKSDPGKVVFFDSALKFVTQVTVGALPDMLTFTPDGKSLLVANEGEPEDDYSVDPEGSVSIIRLKRGLAHLTQNDVLTADFRGFNGMSREELFNGNGNSSKPAIRVFGPEGTVAQNLEPEYITVSEDSKTAWVALQEANALAIIDIRSAKVTRIVGLGTKDHSLADNGFGSGNALDASDKDGQINIRNWPVKGFYQPDAIASYKVRGKTFLLLANEGDSRDWDGYSEEERVKDLTLDPAIFPAALQNDAQLGRLKTTSAQGDADNDGLFEEIYTYGARSFSIRDSYGRLVWDSGDLFAKITEQANPDFFNSNHEENKFDSRSDDKGAEPESVTVGEISGRNYAFVGLERVGGIMVFDVTDPAAPDFVQYVNNRDFTQDPETVGAGDLGPEGVLFISKKDSPNRKPLLVVSNEVSGTTTVYQISEEKGKKKPKYNRH